MKHALDFTELSINISQDSSKKSLKPVQGSGTTKAGTTSMLDLCLGSELAADTGGLMFVQQI